MDEQDFRVEKEAAWLLCKVNSLTTQAQPPFLKIGTGKPAPDEN